MTTDFTPEEIAVRQLLWETSQNGGALSLDVDETKALWASILKTGVELSFLRDGVTALQSPVTGS